MGSRLARCRSCRLPVEFFRSPFTGNVRTFDPTPVDGHHRLAGVKAFPIQGRAAYKPAVLAAEVQVQRACSDAEAMNEVRDMTWHLLHECPASPQPAVVGGPDQDPPTVKETNPS